MNSEATGVITIDMIKRAMERERVMYGHAPANIARSITLPVWMVQQFAESHDTMLALLKELLENEDTRCYPSAIELHGGRGAVDGEDWGNRARAAIAKAEGKS